MYKTVELRVILTFDDHKVIKDADHLKEIAEKAAHALKEEADRGIGLAPEDSTFTTGISVESINAPDTKSEWKLDSMRGWEKTV